MSSVTRGAVFDVLVATAKARVVELVDDGELPRDDAEFLLRALIDYLVARAGHVAADASLLAPVSLLRDGTELTTSARELDRAVSPTHQPLKEVVRDAQVPDPQAR